MYFRFGRLLPLSPCTVAASRLPRITVEKFTIYNTALLLDTRTSTDESRRVLEEALLWGAETLRLRYATGMIKTWRYLSQLKVQSDAPLLFGNMATANLCKRMGTHVEQILGQKLEYEPVRLDIDFSRFERQVPLAYLTIQRRAQAPFSENKYFSEAPLPTALHKQLLEQYEADFLQFCLPSLKQ